MAKNGKAIGGAGERLIAKILSKWMGSGDKEVWIWRSPGSGSMSSVRGIQSGAGDLVAIDPKAAPLFSLFSLEIKTGYADTSIDNCLKDNKNENLRAFWEQCNEDAAKGKKFPMLIYNKKGSVTKNMWIGLCENGVKRLKKLKKLPSVKISFENKYKLQDLYIFNFGMFLETISPEDLQ